jgi:hypothetical protein
MKKASFVTFAPFLNGEIFNLQNPVLNRDDCLLFYHYLREFFKERGVDLNTQDINPVAESDFAIYLEMPKQMPVADRVGQSYLLLQESAAIRPDNWEMHRHRSFAKIFSWSDLLVDGKKYFKLNFTHAGAVDFLSFAEKSKFCTLIAGDKQVDYPGELYSERRRAIRWFEVNHPAEFEFYGVGWDLHTFTGPIWKRAFNRIPWVRRVFTSKWMSYRGRVSGKLQVLRNYKFSICYENVCEIPGYITEKVFDSMAAGCIPVYWGAPNITDYVPELCFVDRRKFSSYEELYAYLSQMTATEYDQRLAAIRKYLASDEHAQFTPLWAGRNVVDEILRAP